MSKMKFCKFVLPTVSALCVWTLSPTLVLGSPRDGTVQSVLEDGRILLSHDDKPLELWGLRVTDTHILEALTVGNRIRCKLLIELEEAYLVDCDVWLSDEFISYTTEVNLFSVLPVLGAAVYDCTGHHHPPDELVRNSFNGQMVWIPSSYESPDGNTHYGCIDDSSPGRQSTGRLTAEQ